MTFKKFTLREKVARIPLIIKYFRGFLQKKRNMNAPVSLICI